MLGRRPRATDTALRQWPDWWGTRGCLQIKPKLRTNTSLQTIAGQSPPVCSALPPATSLDTTAPKANPRFLQSIQMEVAAGHRSCLRCTIPQGLELLHGHLPSATALHRTWAKELSISPLSQLIISVACRAEASPEHFQEETSNAVPNRTCCDDLKGCQYLSKCLFWNSINVDNLFYSLKINDS